MNLKQLLPIENYSFTTHLTAEELEKRLYQIVQPTKGLFNNNDLGKPYEGWVNKNSYVVNRVINYRNSFLPVIIGTYEPFSSLTQVNIKMRLQDFVLVFLAIWFGILSLAIIAISFNIGSNISETPFPKILFPLGMMIFAYLLTILCFKYESSLARKFFSNLFEVQLTSN